MMWSVRWELEAGVKEGSVLVRSRLVVRFAVDSQRRWVWAMEVEEVD